MSARFEEAVVVVHKPFVPNVELIRASLAKYYGDTFDAEPAASEVASEDAPSDSGTKEPR